MRKHEKVSENMWEPWWSDAWLLRYCTLKFFRSAFIAVFDKQYLQRQVGSKTILQQLGLGAYILHNYQIYFDQLLCFQEISVTESQKSNCQNFAVMVKKYWFMRNGTIFI